jgi:hypothetical protein
MSGPFLPESWDLVLRYLEPPHKLSSFGLRCSKSIYYGPKLDPQGAGTWLQVNAVQNGFDTGTENEPRDGDSLTHYNAHCASLAVCVIFLCMDEMILS